MAEQPAAPSNLHALLIGIDFYLPNAIPGVGTYPSLGGCVRDINNVNAFLRNRLGLAPERIVKLTSTNTSGKRPAEPPEAWPTYANMVAAFQKLADVGQAGDQVYIHYSGHGGRATTQYPELKGPRGLDETLVPLDIGNSEARYLRDLELAYLLQKLVEKGLLVTIVLDSCHSGGATRPGLTATIRGVPFIDTSPRPAASLAAPTRELVENWLRLEPPATRNLESSAGWLPEPRDYVLLAACRPSEYAYEYPFDGQTSNGALTYWWLRSLSNLAPGLTYKAVYDQLLGLIHSQFEQQTPILAGDGARTVFGSDLTPVHFAVDVLQVDAAGGQVRLAAGEVQGVSAGDQFALYPAGGSDYSQTQDRLAVVAIEQAGAADSWAAFIAPPARPDDIVPGAQAVRLTTAAIQVQRTVSLAQPDPGAPDHAAGTLERVAGAIAADASGFLALAQAGRPADYQVAVNASGEYEIRDPGGARLPLRPAVQSEDPANAGRIVARLVHLARYRAVLELNNYDDLSPLAHKLKVTLAGVQDDYRRGQRPNPQPFYVTTNGIPTITSGQWTFLTIQNASKQVLNVAALNLQPDWGISQIFPTYQDFEPLDPGEERLIPLRGMLPEGCAERDDIIKVLATLGPTNFRWLTMGALDAPAANQMRGEPRNALEELLASLAGGASRTLAPAAVASEGWVTAQVALRTTRQVGQ